MTATPLPDTISAYGIELRRLAQADIELVRQWRNHPEVARYMLSAEHITPEQQQAWFDRVSQADDRAYYLAWLKGEPVAFASVTTPDGQPLNEADTLEAAIYLAPDSKVRGTLLAFAPALALNDACFDNGVCRQLVARVKKDNEAALRFNAQMGYQTEQEADGLLHMRVSTDAYWLASARIKDFLSRGSRRPQPQEDSNT